LKSWLFSKGATVNIGLVVNARGKVCLVHDEAFDSAPLWVSYDVDSKKIKIIFDTGEEFQIDWTADDEINNYLMKISKILIIRMVDKKPVEGFDTSFLRYRNGKHIEG
jgi:hypothetical protein